MASRNRLSDIESALAALAEARAADKDAYAAQVELLAGVVQSQSIMIAALVFLLQDAGVVSVNLYAAMLSEALKGKATDAAKSVVEKLRDSLIQAPTAASSPQFAVIDGGLAELARSLEGRLPELSG